MIRVMVEDDETLTTTHLRLSHQEWTTITGVELAARLWSNPTAREITLITDYLTKHRNTALGQHGVLACGWGPSGACGAPARAVSSNPRGNRT
ncbi:MAG: hypothetical protein JO272_01210 [Pseudonocardiales bacterium]|nr:hypothetical protein [Pseudonocardiales bacterium]